jgi:hypothetical protein
MYLLFINLLEGIQFKEGYKTNFIPRNVFPLAGLFVNILLLLII